MESGSDRKRPPSASTRGLLEAEIERTRRMTPLERMTLSLELGRLCRELGRAWRWRFTGTRAPATMWTWRR